MKLDRRTIKYSSGGMASEYTRLYFNSLFSQASSLSSSSIASSSNSITSSTGSLYFNSNGIINFNGFRIDFTDHDGNEILMANSQTFASFQQAAWLGYTTGMLIATLRTTAPTGWIMAQSGTIGSASSGASVLASHDAEPLFVKLWQHYTDSQLAVSGGRGDNASNDFAANKTIQLPEINGRVIAASGNGSGLTVRTDYDLAGSESHTITEEEMASHVHNFKAPITSGSFAPSVTYTPDYYSVLFGGEVARTSGSPAAFTDVLPTHADNSQPRSNVEDTLYINYMIKL